MTWREDRVRERTELLQQLTEMLSAEHTVAAAWLFGSIGRGEDDALSDIDLAVVVPDELAADPTYHARLIGDPLLVMPAPEHAPVGGDFFTAFRRGCAGPQAIDWLWIPQSTARRPASTTLVLDRYGVPSGDLPPSSRAATASPQRDVSSVWAMVLWGAKLMARSPDVSPPALLEHAQRSLRRVESRVGAAHTDSTAYAEVVDRMDTLRPLLESHGIATADDLPGQVRTFLALTTPAE